MTKRLTCLAPLTVLLLAGCGGTINQGVESVHQPVVSRHDFAFDVRPSQDGLAPGEVDRLNGWFDSLRVGYGDRVSIDDPGQAGRGARTAIALEVARRGMMLDSEAPITAGEIGPGLVRVVVTRFKASVPGCPDFSRSYLPNYENHTSSNFGCGINSSLAAMVANPSDLVRGEPGSGTVDTNSNAKAINAYRAAAPTGSTGLKSDKTGNR